MTTAHTEGPWKAIEYDWKHSFAAPKWDGRIECPVRLNPNQSKNPYVISTSAFGIFGRTDREARANANLIAAGPELLAALKYVRRMVAAGDADIVFIDAAIAKAEGKSNA